MSMRVVSRLLDAVPALVHAASRSAAVRRVALDPAVVRAGYAVATGAGLVWGALVSTGRLERRAVLVASGCPRWAFGRGGTTIGAVYLTRDTASDRVIAHEAVHREQWRRYGLAFIPLYLAAGADATRNRFEIEAGLEAGGYR